MSHLVRSDAAGYADAPTAPAPTFLAALKVVFDHLSPARRRAVLPLLFLMLAGALAELFTIGALLPFLGVIADPDGSAALAYVRPVLTGLGVVTPAATVAALTVLFAFAALVAAAIRLWLLWAGQRLVFGVAYELGVAVYANALHQPYAFHVARNSSEIIAGVNKVHLVTHGVLMPLMQATSAAVIAAFIVFGLIVIDPVVALAAGIGFGLIYVAVTAITRARLNRNSQVIAAAQTARVKAMQEGLGGIRDVLLDHSQPVFVDVYEKAEAGFRDAFATNAFFAQAPRFVVEAAGMVLIAVVAVLVTGRPGGVAAAIPVLGALALGAQRLLPLIQQVYLGWANALGSRQNLIDIVALVGRPVPTAPASPPAPLAFDEKIVLDDVGFTYAGGRAPVLSDVSLTIPKGARVGVAGRTGSGKSTLTDLVIGLIEPTAGRILVDGVPLTAANRHAWQCQVAHVPQSIYLADASVAENIAFGVRREAIDVAAVRRAAEQAELAAVVAGLPRGYDTLVGERGVQLSGGQRQRIGIARALYKQARVLVFDEATSALDSETEASVMSAIAGLSHDLTIFIIAHRESTLEGCDAVVRLDAGRITTTTSKKIV